MNNLFEVSEVKLTYKRTFELSEMLKALSSKEIYNLLKQCFDPETIDLTVSFKVLLLSPAKNVIGILNVSEGHSFAKEKVKLIMQSALLANADRIIIAHNHTDGDLTVRAMDDYITKQVKKASEMFGIELLDHIIITRESYYSFADNKRL
jgi:DNA repair protein RadC